MNWGIENASARSGFGSMSASPLATEPRNMAGGQGQDEVAVRGFFRRLSIQQSSLRAVSHDSDPQVRAPSLTLPRATSEEASPGASSPHRRTSSTFDKGPQRSRSGATEEQSLSCASSAGTAYGSQVRLPGKVNPSSHCARPVHLIITMI